MYQRLGRVCVSGRVTITASRGTSGKTETKTVNFGRTFSRNPTVTASLSGFHRHQDSGASECWGLYITVPTITRSSADIQIRNHAFNLEQIEVAWMACEV